MANVYVTQTGSGTADGSSLADSIAIGDLTTTQWNTPAHSADGAERIYLYGTLTSMVQVAGAGGTSDTLRLWIDYTNATIAVTNNVRALITNQKSNLMIVGGNWISTANTTSQVVYIFGLVSGANNVTFKDATITASHCGAISAYTGLVTCTNIVIENNTIIQSGGINAIAFNHSVTPGDAGIYISCTVKNNNITGGKISTGYTDGRQQIVVDGRRDVGWDIDNNTISDLPANAIQMMFIDRTPVSYIRNNTITNVGLTSGVTNALQLNNNHGLVVEHNTISGNTNAGASGDGTGVMIDWAGTGAAGGYTGAYSEDCIVRYNKFSGCTSWEKAGGIAIWAGIRTQVYGNLSTGNSAGITVSDAISNSTFTFVSATAADPCVITFSQLNDFEIFDDDQVIISGNTGSSPDDINGTWTATRVSATSFSINADTTGGAGTGTVIGRIHRGFDNVIYDNICVDNATAGCITRYGNQFSVLRNNIFKGSLNGYYNTAQYGGTLAVESNNCFYDNSVNDILDGTTPTAVDATSMSADPLFIDTVNYELQETSPCVGAGVKHWGNGPRPTSYNGEPKPDTKVDIGNQSTWDANHPKNL